MKGTEMISHIRSISKIISIIALTTEADEVILQQFNTFGINSFIGDFALRGVKPD